MSRPLAHSAAAGEEASRRANGEMGAHADASDAQIAVPNAIVKNGTMGMNAPTAVAVPVRCRP